jgi:hypothetical protein
LAVGRRSALYRLYHFFRDYIPTSPVAALWKTGDQIAGPGSTGYVSSAAHLFAGAGNIETDVIDTDWFVVECQTPYVGAASKFQVCFGIVAGVGGFAGFGASPAAGLWAVASPFGGFIPLPGAANFGTNPKTGYDLNQQVDYTTPFATATTPILYMFAQERRMELVAQISTEGTLFSKGFIIGHRDSLDSSAVDTMPFFYITGTPKASDGGSIDQYDYESAGQHGRVLNAAGTAFELANIRPYKTSKTLDGRGASQVGGTYMDEEALIIDATLGRQSGYLTDVKRCDNLCANASKNLALTRICWQGFTDPKNAGEAM